ncbi:type 2 isopentenyl-diphosphate Delta-isomerase [Bacillus sp. FJAT-42315]|uniref:type 2 isopentenyl-diphosphate Delta-isomerase n=1 Tax=Bacillus sp. FJAT-42315 TaxID=2014077 RepID=UPI000C23B561|nr:type 2 isopentenyl-diphosphate Delta-isomerase [Bacillus sp. FJAT-42315]
MTREQRKREHIQYALSTGQSRATGFDDVDIVHQSLPNIALNDVSIQTKIGELTLSSPIFINAMTGGGGRETERINESLAIAARELGLAMAVGSQMSAIKNPSERQTFRVVRQMNPKGMIWANIGSEATVEQAQAAVEMLEANALQIHLNVIQELAMPEGDRDFSGACERIQAMAESLPVPVIVKETGFGLSKEAVRKLAAIPLAAVDIGGFGGTNFAVIENARRNKALTYFNNWGISTAASIVEAKQTAANNMSVIASGGMQNSLDVFKALILGANAVGMAGFLLKVLLQDGFDSLLAEIKELHEDLHVMMCALGATSIEELQQAPVVIKGETYHWLDVRGFEPALFSRRS